MKRSEYNELKNKLSKKIQEQVEQNEISFKTSEWLLEQSEIDREEYFQVETDEEQEKLKNKMLELSKRMEWELQNIVGIIVENTKLAELDTTLEEQEIEED